MDFKGKVVLITGASSGIGAATAIYLAGLGAKLALTGRNVANLQKTVDECKKQKGAEQPFAVAADLANEKEVEKIIDETIKKYNRLDVLVNNAAFGKMSNLETCLLQDYDEIFQTNVRAVLQLTKLAMPHLIKTKGNVVNVSSAIAIRAMSMGLAYAMSKAALDHFTKCVALEVAPKQVRVNSVNPGVVPTDFYRRYVGGDVGVDLQLEDAGSYHPLGRAGQPVEIAQSIAFLSSDLASNITGAILCVDGGFTISFGRTPSK